MRAAATHTEWPSENLCKAVRLFLPPFPFLINIKLQTPVFTLTFWPVFSVAAGGETGGQNNHRLLTFWPVTSFGLSWVPDKLYQRDTLLLFGSRCKLAIFGPPWVYLDACGDSLVRSCNPI